ncbi:hypothetical protein V1525DRAFT_437931 [Lipomyces kononenkoae]|uniref:Uncharacterized protein n=1 Tax=Lipomyces kononenkoae TaxID=34357 RepID=A0ACC3SSI6_LIPKO
MEGEVQDKGPYRSLFTYNFSSSGCNPVPLVFDKRCSCNFNANREQIPISKIVCVRNDDSLTTADSQVESNVTENDFSHFIFIGLVGSPKSSTGYYQHRLQGTGKMDASVKVAEHVYRKETCSKVGKVFESTGTLPSAGHRGKHVKQRPALCDEDVKRKCIQFFESIRIIKEASRTENRNLQICSYNSGIIIAEFVKYTAY